MPRSSNKISPSLKKRAKQIKVLLMDVDGTITSGGVTLGTATLATFMTVFPMG